MAITEEEFDYLINFAEPTHPKEPERARKYREAFDKEMKRRDREKLLREVLQLIKISRTYTEEEIEKFIVGEKIDLLEYNKQLMKELGISG